MKAVRLEKRQKMKKNLDKKIYRLKCRILARKISRLRLEPYKIPAYLSKQQWFMRLQGVSVTNKGRQKKAKFAKNGAYKIFGQHWCDECMKEELILTRIYRECEKKNDPTNVNSYFDICLRKNL